MKALSIEEFKEILKLAYHAGSEDLLFNIDVDKLIDEGTKAAPAKRTFEEFYNSLIGSALNDTTKHKERIATIILPKKQTDKCDCTPPILSVNNICIKCNGYVSIVSANGK